MAKYEFKKISIDNFELHYEKNGKEVVIPFKRTIALAKKMQSLEATARFNMLSYLNSIEKTKKDLIIERKMPDGSTQIDESNYREFEENFLVQERYKLANEVFEDLLGKNLIEIVVEIGLNEEEEAFKFSSELREIITTEDYTPRTTAQDNEQLSNADTKQA